MAIARRPRVTTGALLSTALGIGLIILFGQSFVPPAYEFLRRDSPLAGIALFCLVPLEAAALLGSLWYDSKRPRKVRLLPVIITLELFANIVLFVGLYGIGTI